MHLRKPDGVVRVSRPVPYFAFRVGSRLQEEVMANVELVQTPSGQRGMTARLTLSDGWHVALSGTVDDLEPEVEGDGELAGSRALVTNLWACAHYENSVVEPEPRTSGRVTRRGRYPCQHCG